MISLYKKIIYLLDNKQKNFLYIILFLSIIGVFLEIVSVGAVFPFLGFLIDDRNAGSSLENLISNYFNFSGKNEAVIVISLIFLFIFLIKNTFLIFLQWISSRFALNLETNLSKRLYEHYLRLPYLDHLNKNSATLIRNIKDEIILFRDRIIEHLQKLFLETLTLVSILILLIIINPLAAIVGFSIMGITSVIYILFTKKRIYSLAVQRQKFDEVKLKSLQQTFNGIREIKLSNKEDFFLKIFDVVNFKSLRPNILQYFFLQIPRFVLEFVGVLSILSIFFFLFFKGYELNYIIKTIAVYGVASFRILPSVNRIVQCNNQIRYGIPVLNLLYSEFKNLNERKIENSVDKKSILSEKFNSLEIKNLSFFYNSTDKILNNVNAKIKNREIIGIEGKSGSGKSTLVDLLSGLINPKNGKILINERPLNENLVSWQKNIGYVSQEIFILDDTITNNITFGSEKKDINKIHKLIEILELDGLIKSLPNGLESEVGERGLRISGGQKQRIGIARALYRDPEVIIFDEATNALDKVLEKKIINNIKNQGNKTIIIISHNLDSVKNLCTQVFTIKNNNLTLGS